LILVDPLEDGFVSSLSGYWAIAIGPSARLLLHSHLFRGPYITLPDNSGCFFNLFFDGIPWNTLILKKIGEKKKEKKEKGKKTEIFLQNLGHPHPIPIPIIIASPSQPTVPSRLIETGIPQGHRNGAEMGPRPLELVVRCRELTRACLTWQWRFV